MALYSRIVRDFLYPLDRWRTGDILEWKYFREFDRTQFLPPDQLQQLASERLRRVVDHAYRRCAFYRRRFDQVGIVPSDIESASDLQEIPPLEKSDIQQYREGMISDGWPLNDLVPNQTGGSTGAPIAFCLSHERLWARHAATRRHDRWAGHDYGDKSACVWGAPPDRPSNSVKYRLRNLLLDRNLYLDTANITEKKLRSFDVAMKKFRPKTIIAYARSLALLARFVKANGITPFQPHSIITSAEVLTPNDRHLIEEVFGCRVFNRYGCREFSVVASECSEHDGLHTMAEGLHVEVVRGDRPAKPGEVGEILVTDLINLAMPMIRYRIGDMAVHETAPCACGRALPRLKSIEGRVTDFLVGTDGRLVSGVFLTTYVIAHRPSLGQVQLWQEAPGRVLFRLAPPDGKPPAQADIEFLQSQTRRYLGSTTQVDYELCDEIEPEASGKFLFCRSSAACDYVETRTI